MFKKKEKEEVKANDKKNTAIGCLVIIVLVLVFALTQCGKSDKKEIEPAKNNAVAAEQKKESDPEDDAKKQEENNILATQVVAQNLIEEKIEKQRMKGFAPSSDFVVAKYSDKPIKDQDGNEYPISYMVSGQYEEKGSGALRDFVICIAYKSQTDIDNFNGYCLQYINQDTNKYFNIVAKEDDILEKLKDIQK